MGFSPIFFHVQHLPPCCIHLLPLLDEPVSDRQRCESVLLESRVWSAGVRKWKYSERPLKR
jgi:hypothetical protein